MTIIYIYFLVHSSLFYFFFNFLFTGLHCTFFKNSFILVYLLFESRRYSNIFGYLWIPILHLFGILPVDLTIKIHESFFLLHFFRLYSSSAIKLYFALKYFITSTVPFHSFHLLGLTYWDDLTHYYSTIFNNDQPINSKKVLSSDYSKCWWKRSPDCRRF